MRRRDEFIGILFSYVDLEKRVRANRPIRLIWLISDEFTPLNRLNLHGSVAFEGGL